MATFTTDQKRYIISQFAAWRTPQEIADLVKEEFGLDVPRQTAAYYDPERNTELPQIWRDFYASERERFLADARKIPIANQSYRLKTLQKLLDNQLTNGRRINPVVVTNLLEQAAKEIGGMFTNRRELTGANGKPLMDTAEVAKAVYHELMTKEGASSEEAISFVVERYKVPEDVIVVAPEGNN